MHKPPREVKIKQTKTNFIKKKKNEIQTVIKPLTMNTRY